jgi:hypothetical protein
MIKQWDSIRRHIAWHGRFLWIIDQASLFYVSLPLAICKIQIGKANTDVELPCQAN